MASPKENVLFETVNSTGIMTLNRPKNLNTLILEMFMKIYTVLQKWEKDKSLVIIKGAGDKAFCAGGDAKIISIELLSGNTGHFKMFAWHEYRLIALIGSCKIPYVAFIDKITMGGGAGVCVHGRYRVATERTVFAMPETKIGLFPDVGSTYFLPRLQDNLGIYLGLTSNQLKGRDVLFAGIATHYVPSGRLDELQTLLTRCTTEQEICNLLNKFTDTTGAFSLADEMKNIAYCFAAYTVEEIYERLERIGNDWANDTIQILNKMCPSSLKITLRALQRGSRLDLRQCLQMEYRLSTRFIREYNFNEGIRAVLFDKDNNPKWNPKTIEEVTDSYVEELFKKLPDEEELKFEQINKL